MGCSACSKWSHFGKAEVRSRATGIHEIAAKGREARFKKVGRGNRSIFGGCAAPHIFTSTDGERNPDGGTNYRTSDKRSKSQRNGPREVFRLKSVGHEFGNWSIGQGFRHRPFGEPIGASIGRPILSTGVSDAFWSEGRIGAIFPPMSDVGHFYHGHRPGIPWWSSTEARSSVGEYSTGLFREAIRGHLSGPIRRRIILPPTGWPMGFIGIGLTEEQIARASWLTCAILRKKRSMNLRSVLLSLTQLAAPQVCSTLDGKVCAGNSRGGFTVL